MGNNLSKRNFIAWNRKLFPIKSIANKCKDFINQYENSNYDIDTNGESWVLKILSKQNYSCVFDVGANKGEWALKIAHLFPNSIIHAFEIAPVTYGYLLKTVADCKNVRVNNIGLSNKKGEIELKYYPKEHFLSSIYNYPHQSQHQIIKVNTISGDEYLKEQKIDTIDFLKIDTEGSEHLVLMGFDEALKRKRISIVQFEYGKVNILSKFLLYDYYNLFKNYGYKVGKIYPNYVDFSDYTFEKENFIGPNFIAVKEEREDLIKELKG